LRLTNDDFFLTIFKRYVVARARVVDFDSFKAAWSKKFPEQSLRVCEEI
jgi:hypothetical protein